MLTEPALLRVEGQDHLSLSSLFLSTSLSHISTIKLSIPPRLVLRRRRRKRHPSTLQRYVSSPPGLDPCIGVEGISAPISCLLLRMSPFLLQHGSQLSSDSLRPSTATPPPPGQTQPPAQRTGCLPGRDWGLESRAASFSATSSYCGHQPRGCREEKGKYLQRLCVEGVWLAGCLSGVLQHSCTLPPPQALTYSPAPQERQRL